MCLILFASQSHPRYPLVVAANRDEFHQRPTETARFWNDHPELMAGRDLEAGGTWMGITRQGRFAAVTNYREPLATDPHVKNSRGHLARDFLLEPGTATDFAEKLHTRGEDYSGFNALFGGPDGLVYISNRSENIVKIKAGSHGLSNHLLNTDWPKLHAGRARLDTLLECDHVEPEALLELLSYRGTLPGEEPPAFDLRLAPELITRTTFIVSPTYGTRSSTVLLVDRDGNVTFIERQFTPAGTSTGTQCHQFRIV